MRSLLTQVVGKNHEIAVFISGVWFEGCIMSMDEEIILFNNLSGKDDLYYTTAIRIDAIEAIQFITDFRPQHTGLVENKALNTSGEE